MIGWLWRRLRQKNQLERLLEAWRAEVDEKPLPDTDIVYLRFIRGGAYGTRQSKGRTGQEGPPEEEEPLNDTI